MVRLMIVILSLHADNLFIFLYLAFFALTNHLPLIVFPTDKDSNMHSLMAETEEAENLRLRLTSNPIYANIMKDLYPFYYNRGLFNFDDYITEWIKL